MYSVQWLAKTFLHFFPDILRVLYETLKNLITIIMATIQIQLLPNYPNYRNRINFERLWKRIEKLRRDIRYKYTD